MLQIPMFVSIACLLGLAACAPIPVSMEQMVDRRVKAQEREYQNAYFYESKFLNKDPMTLGSLEVCMGFYAANRIQNPSLSASFAKSLLARRIVSPVDLVYASKGLVRLGMSSGGVIAALGFPNDTNRTMSAGFYSTQLVYRDVGPYKSTKYIYLNRADIVTTIQD